MKKLIYIIISILFFTCNSYAERLIPPFSQYFDGDGSAYAGGLMYFYYTGTTTEKTTYSDKNYLVQNTNPVVLDSNGRIGDVFGQGEYKAVLKTSSGITVQTAEVINDTGSDTDYFFEEWTSTKTYSTGDIVYRTDPDAFYSSIIDSNLNNDPTDSGYETYWMRFEIAGEFWKYHNADHTTYGWPLECAYMDTGAGSLTLTLHSDPNTLDTVKIFDIDNDWSDNNLTITSEDGKDINWVSSDYTCDGSDTDGNIEKMVILQYYPLRGWLLKNH